MSNIEYILDVINSHLFCWFGLLDTPSVWTIGDRANAENEDCNEVELSCTYNNFGLDDMINMSQFEPNH